MPISMNPAARYGNAGRIFNTIVGKPLTNRRIAYYQKQGYYSNGLAVRSEAAKQLRVKRRLSMSQVFDRFNL